MCEFQEKQQNDSKNKEPATPTGVVPPTEIKTVCLASEKSSEILFDDALTFTKFGKFNVFLIFVCGMNLAAVLLETLGISFVLPVSECDMRLTTQQKGVLSAIGFAGIITSSHLWGFLADTKGRRRVIRPTLIASFVCTLLSSLQTQFWSFTLLRFLSGFFISGSSATIYAYLGEFHNTKNRSRAIMGASVIFGLGCMLLPAIAWAVINHDWEYLIPFIGVTYKPWRLFLVVCGLPSLFCAACLFKIPESPKFLLCQGKESETKQIILMMHRINTGGKKHTELKQTIVDENDEQRQQIVQRKKQNVLQAMWQQTAPLFMRPHLSTTVISCTLQFGIFATSNGMYMWFPDILNRIAEHTEHSSEPATICEVVYATRIDPANSTQMAECQEYLELSTYGHTLVLELLYAVGFAFIGFIINAAGKLPILFVIMVGCGICGVVTIFVPIPLVGIYLYLILLLCGLAITVVNAATVDLFPTHLRAMAICISLMMGRLGSVVGANIVGLLLDYHCETAFLASGLSLILCGFLAFLIPKSNAPKPQSLVPELKDLPQVDKDNITSTYM